MSKMKLKVTKREIEMFEVEYYRRYNYRLNTIIAR